MRIIRKIKSRIYKVPFRDRVWYNLMAMLPVKERKTVGYIDIFDENDNYIDCPKIGGMVKYRYKGNLYLYKIVDFQNESRDRDWIFDTDYIHPIIEFVKKLKQP